MFRRFPFIYLGQISLAAGLLVAPPVCLAAPPASSETEPRNQAPPFLSQGSVSPSGTLAPAPPMPKDSPTAPLTTVEAESALRQALKVRQTGSNTFQIGLVEFDRLRRTVSLPARVAIRTQIVEYALVNENGKAYESLLTTQAKASDVHVAFLLLGVSQAPVAGELDQAEAVPATNSLGIEVAWQENGRTKTNALCDLMVLVDEAESAADQRKEPMSPTWPPGLPPGSRPRPMPSRQWLYNGSVFDDFGFAAQREGSIIAVIRDSTALVNNPGEDRDNHHIHFPNTKLLPAKGSLVRVVLRLPERAVQPLISPPARVSSGQ
jgi:hypothetical protein